MKRDRRRTLIGACKKALWTGDRRRVHIGACKKKALVDT